MQNLSGIIEACLLAAAKPIFVKDLVAVTGATITEVTVAISELSKLRNVVSSGIHVLTHDGAIQLVSNPDYADCVSKMVKDELTPQLTRPSLEALTIIAYRGPVTKPEIEAIRGVNCSLILRNLLVRGLIEERPDILGLQIAYSLSTDALRFLGLHNQAELPDYATLHANVQIDKLLAAVLSDTTQIV